MKEDLNRLLVDYRNDPKKYTISKIDFIKILYYKDSQRRIKE
jgi:hypothetical protein